MEKKMERQEKNESTTDKNKKTTFSGDFWETVKKWYLKQNE